MLIFLFLASIALANVMVTYLGPVPVGFGLYAPAGVYVIAVILVLRDLVQRFNGVRGLVIAGAGGVALSYFLASAQVTTASVLAFAVSLTTDTLIFTLVYHTWRRSLPTAVLLSGMIALVPDTFVFLSLIHATQFVPGQLVAKAMSTLIAYGLVWAFNRLWPRTDLERAREDARRGNGRPLAQLYRRGDDPWT